MNKAARSSHNNLAVEKALSGAINRYEQSRITTADTEEAKREYVENGIRLALYDVLDHAFDSGIAYADVGQTTQVSLGGTYDANTGTASGGVSGASGTETLAEYDAPNTFSEYNRYVLSIDGDGASLRREFAGDYATNSNSEQDG